MWEMTFEEIGVNQVSHTNAIVQSCLGVLNTTRFYLILWINPKILVFKKKKQFSLTVKKSLISFNVENYDKADSIVEHSFNLAE